MKNKVALVVAYIGDFPNYFDIWEKTASYNTEFDFHIFCDKPRIKKYKNIDYHKISFSELKKKLEDEIGFEIILPFPYKICDYKPLYGLIFKEYLVNYTHWGFCDTDIIWGNLSEFIKDEILENFDKIYRLGHLTIFKNNDTMNSLYKKDNKTTIYTYEKVYKTKLCCHFDEVEGISTIAENSPDIKCYSNDDYADVCCDYFKFTQYHDAKKPPEIFRWNQGKLTCLYVEDDMINEKEYAYMHIQKRKMSVEIDGSDNSFLIVPNKFIKDKDEINKEFILENSKDIFYKEWYKKRIKLEFNKIKQGAIREKIYRMKRKKKLEKEYNVKINLK